MPDKDERSVMNHLIALCKDEEMALRYAADHVKDPAIKALIAEVAAERAQFATDLLAHALRLGGAAAADGTTRGALHRAWLAIKDAVIGSSDEAMIAEAEHDEDVALATYENTLNDMLLPTARDLIERQRTEIRAAHDRVRTLMSH